MAKKLSETPRRKPAKSTAEPKKPASKKVEIVSAETGARVKTALITAEEILHQLRSEQPIDTTKWKGYSVEIRDGKVFIYEHRRGAAYKKVVNGESLRPALPAATEAPAPADTSAAPAAATEQPALAAPAAAPTAPAVETPAAIAPAAPAPIVEAPVPAQPAAQNGNSEENGRKLPPPPPRRQTPPLGTLVTPAAAEPTPIAITGTAEPKVVIPAMENPTTLIPAVVQAELNTPTNVKIFVDEVNKLKRHINNLIGQADLLLHNGKLESGADIATIINSLENYEQEIATSERFYVSKLEVKERKSAQTEEAHKTLRELDGRVKEKLLELRNKQNENGEAEKDMAVIETSKKWTKIALESVGVIAVIAAVTAIATQKDCGDKNATPAAVKPTDAGQVNMAPLPPEMPEQTPPPSAPTQPELTPKLPAKKRATFNCDIDTAGIKCVDLAAPDADVTEDLDWAGEYNPGTGTIPAAVTLTTPDGQQFKATFDAKFDGQNVTRQKLTWILEAQ